MKRSVFPLTYALLGMLFVGGVASQVSHAREFEGHQFEHRDAGALKGLGKKGGDVDPPADPQCTEGNAGPLNIYYTTEPCKKKKKDGVRSCITKVQQCVGGVGSTDSESTKNCGPCVVVHGAPGVTDSLEGGSGSER